MDQDAASCQRVRATNYFRLVQLTMIEGTSIVRKTILARLRQKKTLHTILSEKRTDFVKKGSGFNKQQLDILYPVTGNADLARIDMTLWFALARKLQVLPKSYSDEVRLDNPPLLGTQVEWCQDLATIHAVRNNLFHLVKPEMESEIFDDQWNRVAEALTRLDPSLDPSVDFERYRSAELNQGQAREFQLMIKEQCLQEKCEELTEEVTRKHRIIHMIMLIICLVLVLVLVGVIVFYLVFRLPRSCDKYLQYNVVGNLAGLYILPRDGWGAEAPGDLDPIHMPIPSVEYTHTAEISACSVTQECCNQVKNIQYLHMHVRPDRFADIGFHYLIDNKGIVYQGRNITKKPAAVHGYNSNITSIAFIGNFMYQSPTPEAIGAFDILLAYLKLQKYIIPEYSIYAMCEYNVTESPGRILYNMIDESTLPNIHGHVKHRTPNFCYFNETMTAKSEFGDEW